MLTSEWINVFAQDTTTTAGQVTGADLASVVPILISMMALVVSSITAYTNWRTHSAKRPMVDIGVEDLPPYPTPVALTTITLKNVGSAPTVRDPDVEITFSWMPALAQRLRLPHENYCLDPNEQMSWKVRLDESFPPYSRFVVRVFDGSRHDYRDSWERHVNLPPPP